MAKRKSDPLEKVREERAKLSAAFVSSIGVGVIVIGVARPFFDPSLTRGLGAATVSSSNASYDLLVIAISMVVGFICHLVARALLRGMAGPAVRRADDKAKPGSKERSGKERSDDD